MFQQIYYTVEGFPERWVCFLSGNLLFNHTSSVWNACAISFTLQYFWSPHSTQNTWWGHTTISAIFQSVSITKSSIARIQDLLQQPHYILVTYFRKIKVIRIKPRDRIIEIGMGDEECILEIVSRGAYLVQPRKTGLLYFNTSDRVNSRTDHKSL